MSVFRLPPRHYTPANGVVKRAVPGQMAPERCISVHEGIGGEVVTILARDLSGVVRAELRLSADDVSPWWFKVLRHWLAWCYGASDVKIVS